MSTYYVVEGRITYKDTDSFNLAVSRLQTGRWMNQDGQMIDEAGDVMGDGDNCPHSPSLTITIPYGLYRNVGFITGELFHGAVSGALALTCTDGAEGLDVIWVDRGHRKDDGVDMVDWALAHGLSMDGAAYTESGDPEVDNARLEAHFDWCDRVESHFLEVNWPDLSPKQIAGRFSRVHRRKQSA